MFEYDVYLAGPFFDDKEIKYIELAEKLLRGEGYKVFSPREHFIPNGENMPNDIWAKLVFDMDVENIHKCKYIVAIYHGMYSDSGTAWEIGYAYANNKKIIIVNTDSSVFSLMVKNGSSVCLNSIHDLKNINLENISLSNTKIEQK